MNIITDTRRSRQEMVADYETHLQGLGDLPTAGDLAAPIVTALYDLWSAYEDRAASLVWLMEFGTDIDRYEAEARQCIDTANEVRGLVTNFARGCAPEGANATLAAGGAAMLVDAVMGDIAGLVSSVRGEWQEDVLNRHGRRGQPAA